MLYFGSFCGEEVSQSAKNTTFAHKFAFLEPFTEIIIVKTSCWLYIRLILIGLLACAVMPVEAGSFTVVIDAGHGGKDPGARGARINEKAINLAVALKLGSLIERRSHNNKDRATFLRSSLYLFIHCRDYLSQTLRPHLIRAAYISQ